MSYGHNITLLRNKFKRLVIEFHHHKNSTGFSNSGFERRDRSKPLLTLRTPHSSGSSCSDNEEEQSVDQDQFIGFSEGEEEEPDQASDTSERDRGTIRKLSSGVAGVLRGLNPRREPVREGCSCACDCHDSTEESQDDFVHSTDCAKLCIVNRVDFDGPESLKIAKQLMKDGVTYIEIEEKPRRKRFLFIRSLFPEIHRPKLYHSSMRKAKPSELIPPPDSEEEESCEFEETQSQSATSPIQIIAMSTGPSSPPPTETSGETYSEPIDTPDQSAIHTASPSVREARQSSYSRRPAKPAPSLISLARVDSEKAMEKKLQRPAEPWRVVMNDVSLYAALLSTGSKPMTQNKSSLNLVADFTRSKHHQQQQYRHRYYPQDMSLFQSSRGFSNDENRQIPEDEDTDLLDMATLNLEPDTVMESTTLQIHSLLSKKPPGSRPQSIISDLLGPKTVLLELEHETYDDSLFLGYAYSDDGEDEPMVEYEPDTKPAPGAVSQSQLSVVLPLNIKMNTSNRIF